MTGSPSTKYASLMMATILPLLAAGRGDLSGKDSDNAVTSQLISDKNYEMNLHLWNVKNGDIWTIAGDLELKVTDVARAIGGGFCIGFPPAIVEVGEDAEASNKFDCF